MVYEEILFKEKVYGRTDIQRTKTDHNGTPRAFGSGELKKDLPTLTEIDG